MPTIPFQFNFNRVDNLLLLEIWQYFPYPPHRTYGFDKFTCFTSLVIVFTSIVWLPIYEMMCAAKYFIRKSIKFFEFEMTTVIELGLLNCN